MRFISVFLIFIFSLFIITYPAYADNAAIKLGRGIANAVGGGYEIPRQIFKETDNGGPVSGATVGIAKGIAFAIGRTAVGLYETATFLFPIPAGYEPIIEPEYPFQTEPEYQF